MAGETLDYRPAQTKAVPVGIAQVERTANGGVIVRATYPAGKFREALVGAIVACVALGLFPMPFLWFSGWSLPGGRLLAILPWMLFVALVAWMVIGRVLRIAHSYTLEADREGITIQRFRGRREWCERVPRDQITDVRIGFGQAGKSGRGTAWLIIATKPWHRRNRTLLHDLGGDRLARIADAVREGLGLEPVDWPRGRPRRATGADGSKLAAPDDYEWIKALLFGVMFSIAGLFFAIYGIRNARQAYERLHGFHQTMCVLLDKRVTYGTGGHRWGRHATGYYQAWARVRFDDGGASRTVAGDLFPTNATENGRPPKDVLSNMTVGQTYPLWIDDRDPTRVYLSRGDESPWTYSVMIGGGTIFALAGIACFVEGILSHPRRAGRRRE